MKKNLTLTVIAQMTANYGENVGNLSSVQRFYKGGKNFAMRSKESLKNAVMTAAGFYDDLVVEINDVAQKAVSEDLNAATCRALEGGYMNTKGITRVRKSSFYFTDAVSVYEMPTQMGFHTNLLLASTYAKEKGEQLKEGLMPYNYEFDKDLKLYSFTIDLDKVGVDENYGVEASNEEKAERVVKLLEAIRTLSLVVKGSMDNAEPLFVVGGLVKRKTHFFENAIKVKDGELVLSEELNDKLEEETDSKVGIASVGIFENEEEVKKELKTTSISKFFKELEKEVEAYYN